MLFLNSAQGGEGAPGPRGDDGPTGQKVCTYMYNNGSQHKTTYQTHVTYNEIRLTNKHINNSNDYVVLTNLYFQSLKLSSETFCVLIFYREKKVTLDLQDVLAELDHQ